MTRCHYLLALLLLSPPAHAGNSFSFTVAGHRIHIEAPRHCNSASCVSVSIPGIYQSRRTPDRDDDVAAAPASAPAPAVAAVPKPPAPAAALVAAALPPAPVKPTACPQEAAAPRPQAVAPPIAPPVAPPVAPPAAAAIVPPVAPPVAPPPVVTRPAPQGAPKIIKVEDEAPATTPLGDWQTEGKKGSVRIEPCGRALCGYVINPRSNSSAEIGPDQHEAEERFRMVGQHLQPRQQEHLLCRDRDAGAELAAGRSLRVRSLLLHRQCLDPDQPAAAADHLAPDRHGAALVARRHARFVMPGHDEKGVPK